MESLGSQPEAATVMIMSVSKNPTDTVHPRPDGWSASRTPGTTATKRTGPATTRRPHRALLLAILALLLLGGGSRRSSWRRPPSRCRSTARC